MFMDVNYPDDEANVTWTLVDATTGLNISGFEEISSERIHLDALDYQSILNCALSSNWEVQQAHFPVSVPSSPEDSIMSISPTRVRIVRGP